MCVQINFAFFLVKVFIYFKKVEFHPHLHQTELLKYCEEKKIFLQAYSSLGTGQVCMLVNICPG